MRTGRAFAVIVLVACVGCSVGGGAEPLAANADPAPTTQPAGGAVYRNDFESAAVGKPPEDLMVLGGEFAVKQEGANKLLELPGEPLDTFGVLFGPAQADGLSVSARIKAQAKGRRYPTFAVGLSGLGGHQLRVSPARKSLEIVRNDEVLGKAAFNWESGSWTVLKLQVVKAGEGKWLVQGKAWVAGQDEPKQWMVTVEDKEAPPPGRASIWGLPFSEQPIQFDDLVVGAAR